MSTTCQTCGAKSEMWLCNKHIDDLKKLLKDIPQWIDDLTDVVLRQTRIGNGGKRAKGDEMPSLFAPDTTTAKGETRPTKQAQAATLLDEINNSLVTWTRKICEDRGIDLDLKQFEKLTRTIKVEL